MLGGLSGDARAADARDFTRNKRVCVQNWQL